MDGKGFFFLAKIRHTCACTHTQLHTCKWKPHHFKEVLFMALIMVLPKTRGNRGGESSLTDRADNKQVYSPLMIHGTGTCQNLDNFQKKNRLRFIMLCGSRFRWRHLFHPNKHTLWLRNRFSSAPLFKLCFPFSSDLNNRPLKRLIFQDKSKHEDGEDNITRPVLMVICGSHTLTHGVVTARAFWLHFRPQHVRTGELWAKSAHQGHADTSSIKHRICLNRPTVIRNLTQPHLFFLVTMKTSLKRKK